MKTKIFVLTHKPFNVPPDDTYIPLQVGAEGKEDLGYLKDNTGDNISNLNCYYSELTGIYWIWKNVKDLDNVGVCHYRRYLLNKEELCMTKPEIDLALTKYDILTSKRLDLDFSYYYGFGENHSKGDLDVTMEVLRELYPDFAVLFEKRVHENHTYFGNIMYCSKQAFDDYCAFLFPIFERMHGRLDLDSLDPYHRRLYGFISEFILYVYCEYKGLKVLECKVGIIGEKKETRETKQEIDRLLKLHDIQGAKTYFLGQRAIRPDILMEASDITGELHLCIELISICEFEQSNYGKVIAPIDLPYREMIKWVNELNNKAKEQTAETGENTSAVAIEIARKLVEAKRSKK